MDLASVVAALASVGVRVSGSTPNSSVQVDSSRACPTGLAGPEPSGTINDPGQHFHRVTTLVTLRKCTLGNKREIKTLKFVSASTKGFKGGLAWIKLSKKDMAVTFSYSHTWRPGPPCHILLFPNVVLLFGLQLPEFAMLLNVSVLLWLQSPAWSPPSPQYAPGAYLGRAHKGPSPRVGGR